VIPAHRLGVVSRLYDRRMFSVAIRATRLIAEDLANPVPGRVLINRPRISVNSPGSAAARRDAPRRDLSRRSGLKQRFSER